MNTRWDVGGCPQGLGSTAAQLAELAELVNMHWHCGSQNLLGDKPGLKPSNLDQVNV